MHRRTLPNGVVVTAELDRLDRVKKLTHVKGTTWSGDLSYDYNAVDQITALNQLAHPGLSAETNTFGYDNLQRLTSETHSSRPPLHR